jgi:hypothetical protein
LLKQNEASHACERLKVEKYDKLPCYRISREAIIVATDEEVVAVKWLIKSSKNSN